MKKLNIDVSRDESFGQSFAILIYTLTILFTPEDEGYLAQAKYLLLILMSLYFLFSSRFSGVVFLSSTLLFPLMLYVVASSVWSSELFFSFSRSVIFVSTCVASFSIVARFHGAIIVRSIFYALLIFVASGIALSVYGSEIAIESSWQHYGKWRGLSAQKNVFGLTCVLLFVASIGYYHASEKKLLNSSIFLLSAFLATVGIIQSEARSSVVDLSFSLLVIISLFSFKNALRLVALFWPLLLIFFAFIATLFIDINGAILEVGNFSIDTSNRLTIWRFGFNEVWESDLLSLFGTGFGGFWTGLRLEQFTQMHGWVLANFHNGYISTLFELGLIGVIIVFAVILDTSFRISKNINQIAEYSFNIFFVAIFFQFLVHNVYENNLMRSADINLFLFIISVAMVHKMSKADVEIYKSDIQKPNIKPI